VATQPILPQRPVPARGRLVAIGAAAFVATLVIPAIGPLWVAYAIALAAVGLATLRHH
jgi:hypothetical protein